MKVTASTLDGVLVIEPDRFGDSRGYFLEAFHAVRYAELGVAPIVQLNHSRSVRGTLRGLHFQEPHPQGKLAWVVSGSVYDVVVDVRRGSPQFGHWMGMELTAEDSRQVWIPPGFAHGFCVLSETADFIYGCSDFYAPECERSIAWNDPDLAIDWPLADVVLSARDAAAPSLARAGVLPSYLPR